MNIEELQKIVVQHIVDELVFFDKKLLIEHMYKWLPSNELETLIKEYLDENMIVTKDGHIGFVLTEDNEKINIYSQNTEEKWEKVNISLFKQFLESEKYQEKYAIKKNKLNNIIGFTSWIKKTKEYVFKVRLLNTEVNKKGKIVINEQQKDIIKLINELMNPEKETAYKDDVGVENSSSKYLKWNVKQNFYNIENVKEYKIGYKNELSVLLEILIRKYNMDEKRKKIYYLLNEQIITNKITTGKN